MEELKRKSLNEPNIICKFHETRVLFYHVSGLGFRPMPPESNVESTLIWYRGNDEENYKYWTEELDKFLEGKKNYLYSTLHRTRTIMSVFL